MNITIKHDIGKKYITAEIVIGRFAEELYNELKRLGYLSRLERINQLGSIRVPANMKKNRLDYVNLQLYFHDLIRKEKADRHFKYTYGSDIAEFSEYKKDKKKPTVLDAVQIMILLANIGHFENTFAANMGILEACRDDEYVRKNIILAFEDPDFSKIVNSMIDEFRYKQFNLAVAYLILQRCNKDLVAVKIAKQLLYCYLSYEWSDKMKYIFDIFSNVRNLAYYTYDLPISSVPLKIDITSSRDIISIFGEIQSQYNDNKPASDLFKALAKLLEGSVYNSPSNAIKQYENISKVVRKGCIVNDYSKIGLADLLLDTNSICNSAKKGTCKFDSDNILKLTFEKSEIEFDKVFNRIKSMNYARVGRYYRGYGKQTILVAMDKKADIKAVFRIFKYLTNSVYNSKSTDLNKNSQILNITKFFLYCLLGCRTVEIKPSHEITIYMTKGKKKRIIPIERTINSNELDDAIHELCVIRDYLKKDEINDIGIVIGGSLIVKKNLKLDVLVDNHDQLNEFDGIVIFPNRKRKQLVFFEAKNKLVTSGKSASQCLSEKLVNVGLEFDKNLFQKVDRDCFYEYTI